MCLLNYMLNLCSVCSSISVTASYNKLIIIKAYTWLGCSYQSTQSKVFLTISPSCNKTLAFHWIGYLNCAKMLQEQNVASKTLCNHLIKSEYSSWWRWRRTCWLWVCACVCMGVRAVGWTNRMILCSLQALWLSTGTEPPAVRRMEPLTAATLSRLVLNSTSSTSRAKEWPISKCRCHGLTSFPQGSPASPIRRWSGATRTCWSSCWRWAFSPLLSFTDPQSQTLWGPGMEAGRTWGWYRGFSSTPSLPSKNLPHWLVRGSRLVTWMES